MADKAVSSWNQICQLIVTVSRGLQMEWTIATVLCGLENVPLNSQELRLYVMLKLENPVIIDKFEGLSAMIFMQDLLTIDNCMSHA
ncbi:uncharacterized protein PHALS_05765 [Plasmopara halstedii]|uniref:Uncharacterized protein n=1 Tax=Plasmopara halstedii TaxID=4781 RepID=A0A0P1AA28_PLAHL|nr:uncharacterized protein PHALS_05765 [Plasmopara halstedii]CEG37706.1 hypothetical protein PHALS_05765 [Plasmopara halstedii]|eukprot:XP_024574075.1 hypothetical protein PHALS_05765 [Plasmopara halstedii]